MDTWNLLQPAEQALIELHHRSQNVAETVRDYAEVVYQLAQMAYYDVSEAPRDRLVTMVFIRGLKFDIRKRLFDSDRLRDSLQFGDVVEEAILAETGNRCQYSTYDNKSNGRMMSSPVRHCARRTLLDTPNMSPVRKQSKYDERIYRHRSFDRNLLHSVDETETRFKHWRRQDDSSCSSKRIATSRHHSTSSNSRTSSRNYSSGREYCSTDKYASGARRLPPTDSRRSGRRNSDESAEWRDRQRRYSKSTSSKRTYTRSNDDSKNNRPEKPREVEDTRVRDIVSNVASGAARSSDCMTVATETDTDMDASDICDNGIEDITPVDQSLDNTQKSVNCADCLEITAAQKCEVISNADQLAAMCLKNAEFHHQQQKQSDEMIVMDSAVTEKVQLWLTPEKIALDSVPIPENGKTTAVHRPLSKKQNGCKSTLQKMQTIVSTTSNQSKTTETTLESKINAGGSIVSIDRNLQNIKTPVIGRKLATARKTIVR